METRWTKGPWLAASGPSSVVGWPVVGPMGRSICNVSWSPRVAYPAASDAEYAAFRDECEANANLISSAPALYEALYRITTEAKLDGMDKRAGWDAWVSMANAALRAARGEQGEG